MSETSHNPNLLHILYQYDKNKKSIYQCYCCLFFFTTPKFNFDIVKFWPTLIWTINQSNLQKTPKKNHFGYGTQIIRATLLCLNRLLKSEEGIKTIKETRNMFHHSLISQPFSMPGLEQLKQVEITQISLLRYWFI